MSFPFFFTFPNNNKQFFSNKQRNSSQPILHSTPVHSTLIHFPHNDVHDPHIRLQGHPCPLHLHLSTLPVCSYRHWPLWSHGLHLLKDQDCRLHCPRQHRCRCRCFSYPQGRGRLLDPQCSQVDHSPLICSISFCVPEICSSPGLSFFPFDPTHALENNRTPLWFSHTHPQEPTIYTQSFFFFFFFLFKWKPHLVHPYPLFLVPM